MTECKNCGKEVPDGDGMVHQGFDKFCTIKCSDDYEKKMTEEENIPKKKSRKGLVAGIVVGIGVFIIIVIFMTKPSTIGDSCSINSDSPFYNNAVEYCDRGCTYSEWYDSKHSDRATPSEMYINCANRCLEEFGG